MFLNDLMNIDFSDEVISIKFSNEAANNLERLKGILNEDNNAQLLAEGISVYLDLVEAIKSGKKIFFEDDSGGREIVKIRRSIK